LKKPVFKNIFVRTRWRTLQTTSFESSLCHFALKRTCSIHDYISKQQQKKNKGKSEDSPLSKLASPFLNDIDHTHPNLLKKPEQADLFINRAIELGFDEICFTDHMPFTVTGDEHDRIPFGGIAKYCNAVREIAGKYEKKIKIKLGIEIDYHPSCLTEIESVLSEGDFDYVIGSSHLNISGFGIPFSATTRTEFARMVLENYLSAVNSGYFDTISHLDVYRWVFSEEKVYPLINDGYTYRSNLDLIYRIFESLEKTGVNLEINAAPLYKKFDELGAYPETDILNISRKFKLNYVYGSDAHFPDKVGFGYDYFAKIVQ